MEDSHALQCSPRSLFHPVRPCLWERLGVRIGLHTGECQVKGDSLEGLAIHIAARVSGTAKAGEIVVSSTVKDLVAGSGISFVDAGAHELKGVPDQWQLFSVQR